eukprot:767239-Hanusia_phi.AAC.4
MLSCDCDDGDDRMIENVLWKVTNDEFVQVFGFYILEYLETWDDDMINESDRQAWKVAKVSREQSYLDKTMM